MMVVNQAFIVGPSDLLITLQWVATQEVRLLAD